MSRTTNAHSSLMYSIDLLNELHRDLVRASPQDPLQFCSAWFQFKLEQDRNRARSSSSSSSTAATTTTTTTTSCPLAQHHHLNHNTTTTTTTAHPSLLGIINPIHPHPTPSSHSHPSAAAYPAPIIYTQHPPTHLHPPPHLLSIQSSPTAFGLLSAPPPTAHPTSLPIQSIEPQSYHSIYPSSHPIHSHPPYQHHHHHQLIAIDPQPSQRTDHQPFSLHQPPQPHGSIINSVPIPNSPGSSVHHSLPTPSIIPPSLQRSIPPAPELRSYSFATPNSAQSIHPLETPPRSTDRQPRSLTTPPASYPSPSSHPRRPHQTIDHHRPSPQSPHHSPAPTYDSQTTASPKAPPPSSRSPAPPSLNHHRSSSPARHRLSPSNHRSSVPPVDEESDASNSDDGHHEPIVPAGYNFGRRVSVSAESLSPSSRSNGPAAPKVVILKTADQRQRIEASIKGNLLFRNLDEEQHNDVLNAMTEVRVSKGTEVIVQGAVGDFFYVVEQGTFDVYVRGPPTYTYLPPTSNQSQGTLSLGANNDPSNGSVASMTNPFAPGLNRLPSSQDLGSSIPPGQTPFGGSINSTGGTTLTHQAPSKKVHSYGPGGSFGELALMYNAPRAATVVATSPTATLWALDRVTFRSILIEHTARKRKMYENFLAEVPILVSLSPTEISKIADSLEERSFAEGVDVIKEGEVGREFFIIESGRAEVYKQRNNGEGEPGEEELVGILGKGDHFGELALLNSAPRAATIRAASGTGRLRVAALGEKAFTRLLGPVIDILSRHAESHYGKTSNARPIATGSNPVPPNSVNVVGSNGLNEVGSSPAIVNGNGPIDHSPLSSSRSIHPLPPPTTTPSSATSTPNLNSNGSNFTPGNPNFAHWNGLAINPPASVVISGSGGGTTGIGEDGK